MPLAAARLAPLALALALVATLAAAPPAAAQERVRIVVTLADTVPDPGAVAHELMADNGGSVSHVYRSALKGFAGEVPAGREAAIQRDRRVVRVERDEAHQLLAQSLPTGIDRVEADRNPRANDVVVDRHVAVIDSGIQGNHSDLNVVGGRNFTSLLTSAWGDDNGHGTHVAGTIGARDDDNGVVGVAPGSNLWALKVCNLAGSCFTSDIVAGIDWMTGQKRSGAIDFAVANMSISSADSSNSCTNPADSVHRAICGAVDEGIVFVLAAGNDGRQKVPYPAAFSVSAIADFDGRAGGGATPTCRSDQDDTLADFSNFGSAVDIAAPGVCILSTWNDGGYRTISGTSMAAPHVAGAVALHLHANNQAPARNASGVAAIEGAIIDAAHPQGTANHPCSYDDSRVGGPLLFVNASTFGGDGSCSTVGGDGGGGGEEPVGFTLEARGYKVKGVQHVDLSWSGSDAGTFDVGRDGAVIATVTGTTHTDDIGAKGRGSYTYVVCEAGTSTCSNSVTVTF